MSRWPVYPRFAEIAERFGIPRCRGILPTGHRCPLDHRAGVLEGGLVHWADRERVTRAGVRRFLKLAAFRLVDDERPWVRLYLAQPIINDWARQLGIKMPGHMTEDDRLLAKAMLVNVSSKEPMRDEVMEWALRG